MKVAEVILIGLVLIGGVYWQAYTIKEDGDKGRKKPLRLFVPMYFGVVVTVGLFGFQLIWAFHKADQVDIFSRSGSEMLAITGRLLVVVGWAALRGVLFTLVLSLKGYFGPLVTSAMAAVSVYQLFEFGELRVVRLMEIFLEFVFSQAPTWLQVGYTFVLLLFCAAGPLAEKLELGSQWLD